MDLFIHQSTCYKGLQICFQNYYWAVNVAGAVGNGTSVYDSMLILPRLQPLPRNLRGITLLPEPLTPGSMINQVIFIK